MDQKEINDKAYKRYCDQLDKEDKLINERTNWLLASQSILFTGIAIGKELNAAGAHILIVISIVGFISSLIIWSSIDAAIISSLKYRKNLKEVCKEEQDPNKEFPELHRNDDVLNQGLWAPKWLPIIFSAAWALILIILWCHI